MMNPPSNWFCCLATPEQGVWDYLARSLPATLFLGVPATLVDAARAIFGLDDAWRYDAFLLIYHLARGSATSGEDVIEVILPEDGFLDLWVENSLFILTPAALCLDGCPLSRPPTP